MQPEYVLYYCKITAVQSWNTGIQRVTRQLAKALMQNGVKLIPVGFTDNKLHVIEEAGRGNIARYDGPDKDAWFIPEDMEHYLNNADVLLFPEIVRGSVDSAPEFIQHLRAQNTKSYFVFYDAIPYLLGAMYSPVWAVEHLKSMEEINDADGIIGISRKTLDDFNILTYLPTLETKSKKIAIGLPNEMPTSLAPKINNTNVVKMLMVSTIEPRKNHLRTLKAFQTAQEKLASAGITLHFDIVGGMQEGAWGSLYDDVRSLLSDNAILHDHVSEEELLRLYSEADFTVYTSIYEGYGLPVVESLHYNTPVICSNNSAVVELTTSGGCVLVSPFDEADIADKIVMLASSMEARQELIDEMQSIQKYSWQDYAQDVMNFIQEA